MVINLQKKQSTKFSLSYPDNDHPNAIWIGRITNNGFADLMKSKEDFIKSATRKGDDENGDDDCGKWVRRGLIDNSRRGDSVFNWNPIARKLYCGYTALPSQWKVDGKKFRLRRDLNLSSSVDTKYSIFSETGIYVIVEYEERQSRRIPKYVGTTVRPFEARLLKVQKLYGKCAYITYNGRPINGSGDFIWGKVKNVTTVCMLDGYPITVRDNHGMPDDLLFHFLQRHLAMKGISGKEPICTWYRTIFPSWIDGFRVSTAMDGLCRNDLQAIDLWSDLLDAR